MLKGKFAHFFFFFYILFKEIKSRFLPLRHNGENILNLPILDIGNLKTHNLLSLMSRIL